MRILDAALAANWAMEETALRQLFEIAARQNQVTPEALEAYRANSLKRAELAGVRDGVAILDASGPMFKRANLMTAFSGATSYEVLRRDLQAAVDNPSVHSILLNIDSPGGAVSGCNELAKAICAARDVKPIIAYVGDLAASAGYWIASAASRIVIGESASLGSIGVRATIRDASKQDEAKGVRNIDFISSQSPFKNADIDSEPGRARIQKHVDALAAVFIETVAVNRNTSVERVLAEFGKGDVLVGQAAISAGMADEIGTFESVMASLIEQKGEPSRSSKPARAGLTTKESAMDTKTEISAEDVTKARSEATAAETARVMDIMGLVLPGYEVAAKEAIKSGSSPHEFAALIVRSEQEKMAKRAAAIANDVEENAAVSHSPEPANEGDVEALVKSIVGARAAALGEK